MRRIRITKERVYSEERKNIRNHERVIGQLKNAEKQSTKKSKKQSNLSSPE
jgi:hypothetical protein